MPIQRAQSFENLIHADGPGSPRWAAQCRRSLHGAGVGSPRGKYRAFFVEREIGIANDLLGVLKSLCRMQQLIEIEIGGSIRRDGGVVSATHSHILIEQYGYDRCRTPAGIRCQAPNAGARPTPTLFCSVRISRENKN